jgi:hypothetical protein
MECRLCNNADNEVTIASDLLQQHIQTLVDDNARWQTLVADDILWELAYAPSLGHPAQLSGRKEAVRHATWFVGAVENFRFFDPNVYALFQLDATSSSRKVTWANTVAGRVIPFDVKQCRSPSGSATPPQWYKVGSKENGAVFRYPCSRAGVLPMFRVVQFRLLPVRSVVLREESWLVMKARNPTGVTGQGSVILTCARSCLQTRD